MTNADVIALTQAGIPADIIVTKIRATASTKFDTTVTGLQALIAAKVPSAVIQVMIRPSAESPAQPTPVMPFGNTSAELDDPSQIMLPGIFVSITNADGKTHLKPLITTLTHPVVMGSSPDGRKTVAPVIDGLEPGLMVPDGSPVFYEGVFMPSSPSARIIIVRKAADEQVLYENNDLMYNITVQRINEHLAKISFKKPLRPGRYAIALTDNGPYYAFEVPGNP